MKALDCEGRSELHYAAAEGDLEAVKRLVTGGCDVNLQDKSGWTPLHFAAQARSESVTRYLIGRGAIVDAVDSNGNTPLLKATFESRGDGAVIRALLEAGADREKENYSGVSAIALARTITNYDVAKFFLIFREDEEASPWVALISRLLSWVYAFLTAFSASAPMLHVLR